MDTEKIIEQYNNLADNGYYNKAAYVIADAIGLKMYVIGSEYKRHFEGDKQQRHVFKVQLKKDGKQYTLKFGQSIAEGSNGPTLYDVLSCLQKYDVGSFEDFCGDFGYDKDSRATHKIYKAVLKEWQNMEKMFSEDELELLNIVC